MLPYGPDTLSQHEASDERYNLLRQSRNIRFSNNSDRGDNPRTSKHIPRVFTLHTKIPSHKSPGFSGIPTDLFKQAVVPFQGRIHLLVNEILEGKFDCDQDLLKAKVILIHKDKDIAIIDHYRPIALLSIIYQLINIIITSRLSRILEKYAVMESSQYRFRELCGVQMVVQRAHWVQQQAMKNSGTLVRIDLHFKNTFNSAGHSCLWAILRGLGVPDVDFLEALNSNSWMKIQVGTESTAPIQLDAGTVQGPVLYPILFDLFLNALLRLLNATDIKHGIRGMPSCGPCRRLFYLRMYCKDE